MGMVPSSDWAPAEIGGGVVLVGVVAEQILCSKDSPVGVLFTRIRPDDGVIACLPYFADTRMIRSTVMVLLRNAILELFLGRSSMAFRDNTPCSAGCPFPAL